MEEKQVEFSVNMKTRYMFEFLYVNSYSGFRGVINYGFSVVAIIALCAGYGDSVISMIALLVLASLFTVVDPLLLLFKAWRQVKLNPAFKKPIRYTFNKLGFSLSQDDEKQDEPWELVLLAKETAGCIILFTGNNNALVLPKKDIGSELGAFKDLLTEMRPAESRKLRK